MFVGGHSEFMSTAQAAAFEHGTPIRSGHALAETMHTHTAADFRLIRTFRHSSFLVSKIIAN
jgi:hypothetical protein